MSASAPGRLHVLTDECVQSRFSHVELAELAARGGADVIQFREKRSRSGAELTRIARDILERLAGRGTRLIVNDRIDVAAASGADGVHLGAADASPEEAARRLGTGAWIGVTANDLHRARDADRSPVSYLGVGPVFGTASKSRPAPRLGIAGLERIAATVRLPVIAIGNITVERVADVLAAGAHGIAVLSEVATANDPAERAAEFVEAIARALRKCAT